MSKHAVLALAFLCLTNPVQAANSPRDLVDLVLEKRVSGILHEGRYPVINPHQPVTKDFTYPANYLKGAVRSVAQPLHGRQAAQKIYELSQDPATFQSLIRVTDTKSGQLSSQISVGRRASQVLADPARNRLYVLCGGYFGAIWEIDTIQDIVVRKLPLFKSDSPEMPLWNPQQMALSGDGKSLFVAAGENWKIDLLTGAAQLAKGTAVAISIAHPLKVKVQTAAGRPPAISNLLFMASRNQDYVRMIDRDTLHTIGILPVDFNVDDVLLTPDRKRLFAYHRRFGQVSVIELSNRSDKRFSVVARYQDPRFKSEQPLRLASAEGQVLLWDGRGATVASFDSQSLYPKVGVPISVRPMSEPVWVSKPARQRFYIRKGSIYAEYLDEGPSNLPQALDLGATVTDMLFSHDRLHLYALTNKQELLAIDPATHQIVQRLALGMNPAYLGLSNDGQKLYVIDRDRGSLKEISTVNLTFKREILIDMGENTPQQITLYEPGLSQVIQVELPRYAHDVVRVTR